VAVELLAHRVADCSGAPAVDDADLMKPGERGVVDERPDRLAGLLCARAPEVELVRHVAARAHGDTHAASARRLLGAVAAHVRTEPVDRDPHALSARAHDLGLGSVDRRDRAAEPDRSRFDGIADGERCEERRRFFELAQRLVGASGPRRGRGQMTVAIPFGACGARRRRAARLLLAAAGNADLLSQSPQLGTRSSQIAFRLGHRELSCSPGGCAHLADLLVEFVGALLRLLAETASLGALSRAASRSAAADLSAASASASSSAIRKRSGATRPRASSTIEASRPRRAAVCKACDEPGRPSTTRYSGVCVTGSIAVPAFAASGAALAHSFSSG